MGVCLHRIAGKVKRGQLDSWLFMFEWNYEISPKASQIY